MARVGYAKGTIGMSGIFRSSADGTGPGGVIAMDRFRSGRSLSPIRQAEAYWTALRDGADCPRRTQIDPRGLENILEFTFILERIAPGIARFRLAGQHLSALAGMEVRGMPLTAFFTAAARSHVAATLEHVFDAPAVAELTLTGEGRGNVEARMILLPLKNDLGEVSRALGVLITDGDDLRTPQRFDVAGTQLRALNGRQQTTVFETAPPAPQPQPVQGFAEEQTPLARRAPHLRLVKTDRI